MAAWLRTRLWAQVMAAMALGLVVGILLDPARGYIGEELARHISSWLALPSQIFLGLIAMVLIPLVFASIIGGLTGSGSSQALKAIGIRFAAFVVTATFVAAVIGVTLAQWLRPGNSVGALRAPPGSLPPELAQNDATSTFDVAEAPTIISNMLPTNPTASIVQGDLMAVVVFALLIGIAATQVERDKIAPFLSVLDALLSLSMTIVKWAMFLAPFAVFGMMAQLVMRIGLETVLGVSAYVGTVLLGLALLFGLFLLVAAVLGRIGPVRMLKDAGETLLLAFSTSSSTAVMPSTVKTMRALGVPREVANLVAPLGATMNMAGTALYQSVAILFLAQMSGVDLNGGQIALITLTLVASSIGAPGTPGVSIAILVSVATSFGIPPAGMVIVMGVDRLLDMTRTAVNVAGDMVAGLLLKGARIDVRDAEAV
ncbi:dicarboxylate/amino acid:cation symporter [Erythrobacter sp.]|uniref:dicarboxylate/amino acid:cation symporter n=1 Tax=Erythrobacter sp. TaxID=1042 RepID=UPI001AFCF028|nr:dicarboxylate/amino acid:cation symporter [Erythrobacter sp.]MBO6527964.1 dicarboxylate/amino acid:cation symporter [Erythrobacter sp.]MBO6528643.1 dicarboxylate/amino acid:cation symporter [Erythrobacter sp.]